MIALRKRVKLFCNLTFTLCSLRSKGLVQAHPEDEPLELKVLRGTSVLEDHERALVERIEHLLYVAEYKRRQAPPGVKLTRRAFGKERRYPITNAFKSLI